MTKKTFGRLGAALMIFAGPAVALLAAPKPPAPSLQAVPLTVTVDDRRDIYTNELLPGIHSDGRGEYENGVEGVTANFDTWGNLIIAFNPPPSPGVRKLTFVYDAPVDAGNEFRPPAALTSYLSTQFKVNAPGEPTWPLQNMPVGRLQCVQSNLHFVDVDAAKTMYRTHYRRPLTPETGEDTSYLVITRTSATTWEVEPKFDAGCNSSNETVARLYSNATKGNGAVTARGAYYMPFKMTLVAQ